MPVVGWGAWPMRGWGLVAGLGVCAAALGGCTSVYNLPQNVPLSGAVQAPPLGGEVPASTDDILVSLAFSGGGTRAAAFSFGVLKEIDGTRIRDRGQNVSLLDRVDFVSGVSGGSVTAAYYGLRRREALDRIPRALPAAQRRGVAQHPGLHRQSRSRDRRRPQRRPRIFRAGSTPTCSAARPSREFRSDRRPRIWINASDIYNRTPFVFGKAAFDAMCSDLLSATRSRKRWRRRRRCRWCSRRSCWKPIRAAARPTLPDVDRARPRRPQCAAAVARLCAGDRQLPHRRSMRYIKLLDGGLVDNFGLSGFSIALLSATRPYEPLTPQQAARIRRVMFLIVDSGRGPSGNWSQQLEGPTGVDLVMATADTATEASTRASYTAFVTLMNDWGAKVRRWRCGLSAAERQRLGVRGGWRCNDLNVFVERVGFDQFDRSARRRAQCDPDALSIAAAVGRRADRGGRPRRCATIRPSRPSAAGFSRGIIARDLLDQSNRRGRRDQRRRVLQYRVC